MRKCILQVTRLYTAQSCEPWRCWGQLPSKAIISNILAVTGLTFPLYTPAMRLFLCPKEIFLDGGELWAAQEISAGMQQFVIKSHHIFFMQPPATQLDRLSPCIQNLQIAWDPSNVPTIQTARIFLMDKTTCKAVSSDFSAELKQDVNFMLKTETLLGWIWV